jgi:hypothetical protein
MTEIPTQEEMRRLAREDHERNLQIIEDMKQKLVDKWEPSGILKDFTDPKDKRNMAQMLESQANWLLYLDEKFNDASVDDSQKEKYVQNITSFALPLVVKVFGPEISQYGSMGLPASLGDNGVIIAKTQKLSSAVSHVANIDYDTCYNAIECEAEYMDKLAAELRGLIQAHRMYLEEKCECKLKFYVYIPLIFSTVYDTDGAPAFFECSVRWTSERVDA